MRGFFYDTWAFLALANRRDADHATAVEIDRWLRRERYVATTSDGVLDETLTGLQAAGGGGVSLRFLDLFEQRVAGRELVLLETTAPRREAALATFRRLAPETERLSLTDCASMAVMAELGIPLVFTADRHFHRAGPHVAPLARRVRGGVVAVLPGDS